MGSFFQVKSKILFHFHYESMTGNAMICFLLLYKSPPHSSFSGLLYIQFISNFKILVSSVWQWFSVWILPSFKSRLYSMLWQTENEKQMYIRATKADDSVYSLYLGNSNNHFCWTLLWKKWLSSCLKCYEAALSSDRNIKKFINYVYSIH